MIELSQSKQDKNSKLYEFYKNQKEDILMRSGRKANFIERLEEKVQDSRNIKQKRTSINEGSGGDKVVIR